MVRHGIFKQNKKDKKSYGGEKEEEATLFKIRYGLISMYKTSYTGRHVLYNTIRNSMINSIYTLKNLKEGNSSKCLATIY